MALEAGSRSMRITDNTAGPNMGALASLRRWMGATLLVALASGSGAAYANEWQGSFAWQFMTPAQRGVNAGIAEIIERRRAGGYGPATVHQYNTTNNIAGDQNNCAITANATGNAGSLGASGTTSSPVLNNAPGVSAGTFGNNAAGTQMGGTTDSSQGNWNSSLSSNVAGTTSTLTSGSVRAGGGWTSQVLNSEQRNRNSPQTATVSNSEACRFVR